MALSSTERSRLWRSRIRGSAPNPPPGSAIPRGHRNRDAIERTIAVLRDDGRLDDGDAVLIALVRTTAEAVDAAPTLLTLSAIARVHLEALRTLQAGPEADDDKLDQFLTSLREVT